MDWRSARYQEVNPLDAVPYLHTEPEDPVPLPVGERVGLLVPRAATADGVAVSSVGKAPQAIGFRLKLRLVPTDYLYVVDEIAFTAVPIVDLKQHFPDLLASGAAETIDVDAPVVTALRWHTLRRAVAEDMPMPVLLDGSETHLYDEELTSDELTSLCWLRSRLTFGDVNTLIAAHFGCSNAAAGTRLKRARQAGIVPPVERRGQRKARP